MDQEGNEVSSEEQSLRPYKAGTQMWHEKAPLIEDVLRRSIFVTLTTRDRSERSGNVCDWGEAGVLLDFHDSTARGGSGYMLFPWSNIEYITAFGPEHRKPGQIIFSE